MTDLNLYVNTYVSHICRRPEGRLDLKVSAPLRPSVWMIQAVTLSPIHGIAFNEVPYVVSRKKERISDEIKVDTILLNPLTFR